MENLHINWYPGHMKKTRELIRKNMSIVDVIVEVIDSRIPKSSKNPDIAELSGHKPTILLLNKEDLSDKEETKKWIEYYKNGGMTVLPFNGTTGEGMKELVKAVEEAFRPKLERLQERGLKNRSIRLMIAGIPNSGKSTLINRLAGRKSTQTGDRPGVTKGKQWVKLKGDLEMLDTPGILWPRFDDQEVALMLAFTGAIKDEVLDVEEIAFALLDRLKKRYPINLQERYGVEVDPDMETIVLMEEIAEKRGFILKGREIDYKRTADAILNDFREGKTGRITLEECRCEEE
ncbi:ribosome biogenesis GTPase YlqF [Filifactor villosus]|uniref:Ribosome biogenesis GTPase A n=1 Tax=Filifactor villosus TaxID=29374 RepID=A0ABV9QMA0_9FIRM